MAFAWLHNEGPTSVVGSEETFFPIEGAIVHEGGGVREDSIWMRMRTIKVSHTLPPPLGLWLGLRLLFGKSSASRTCDARRQVVIRKGWQVGGERREVLHLLFWPGNLRRWIRFCPRNEVMMTFRGLRCVVASGAVDLGHARPPISRSSRRPAVSAPAHLSRRRSLPNVVSWLAIFAVKKVIYLRVARAYYRPFVIHGVRGVLRSGWSLI